LLFRFVINVSQNMKNHLPPPRILAVDPGAREIGYAVLEGADFVRCGIKTVRDRKTPATVVEIVTEFVRKLIREYKPHILAIEKVNVAQPNLALLAVVAAWIKAVAAREKLAICEYAPSIVRQRLCRTKRATKGEVAQILTEQYPELNRYYRRTQKWETDYYSRLFDAAALAIVCRDDAPEFNRGVAFPIQKNSIDINRSITTGVEGSEQ
jgi:Holliday junction resolvasome RuvABC endonuclease subunit